ncbi:diguanylate cyclase [Pseudoalteromonas sp. YIC-656]
MSNVQCAYYPLAFICFLFALCAQATQNTSLQNIPLNHYFAETWDTRDGLPHNSINALAQSKDGYIWVGTWEGAARFNGREFTLFTRGQQTGLPDSGIRSLSLDALNQDLYVAGSRGGVSIAKGAQWQAMPLADSMVNFAKRVSDGALWLALEDGGVVRRDANDEQKFLDGVSTYHILEHQDVVWIASSQGLYRYRKGEVTKLKNVPVAISGMIFKLALDTQERLLVGTEQGVWRYDNEQFTLLHDDLKFESISAILVDYRGDIWLGTINHGLFRVSEFGIEKLDANVGLPSNRILSLLEDDERSIWIGTNAGLFRLRQAPFTTLSQARGLSGDYVRAILSHTDGSLYIGTSNGLNRYEGDVAIPLGQDLQAPISVLSLTSAKSGGIYVGTYTDGLLYFDGQQFQPLFSRDNDLASNEIRAVLEQEDGSLWIGTSSGLVHKDSQGKLTLYTDKEGLPGNFIMTLAEDEQGRVWVGTGVGVAFVDKANVTTVPMSQHLDSEYAFGFFMEPGVVWMATDRGLLHYDIATATMIKVGKEQGLPVDKLFAVVVDEFDHFWLTSNRGVIRVSREQLNKSLQDQRHQLEFTLFDQGDGMLSSQANGGSQYPALRHTDNSIWVATARGAAVVDPNKLTRMANVALPVSIESIQYDNEPQSLIAEAEMVVPADVNRLSISYAGLGFVMTERIEYQTKLQGYDRDWVDRGNLSITEYTNLAPGKYQFQVRARYPYGQWQETETFINFKVSPKMWQTVPFKLALTTAFILGLILVYRLRFYHLKRSEAQLKQRVKEQTQVLAEQAQAFEHQATHDQLTGIANRRAFDTWLTEHFDDAARKTEPLSLLIIDIDYFKQINDRYSHLVGDNVIVEVVNVIEACLGEDALFARWGGEEFTILLPHTDERAALQQAHSICDSVNSHQYQQIAEDLQVSVSIGVADNHSAANTDRLLSNVDKALYVAKEQGRNRVIGFERDCCVNIADV